MTSKYRQTARDRYLRKRTAGVIYLDIYKIQIPVFTTDQDCEEVCKFEGLTIPELTAPSLAYAGYGEDKNSCRVFYLMLPTDSKVSTWVHEASHIVDYVIDYLGLEAGIAGTEARAYMLDFIYTSIEEIMQPLRPTPVENENPK